MRKVLRVFRIIVELIILIFLIVSVTLSIITGTTAFRNIVVKLVNNSIPFENVNFYCKDIRTDILMRFVIDDVTITHDRDTLIYIGSARVDYSIYAFIYKQLVIKSININNVDVYYNEWLDSLLYSITDKNVTKNNKTKEKSRNKIDFILRKVRVNDISLNYLDKIKGEINGFYGVFVIGKDKNGVEVNLVGMRTNIINIEEFSGYLWNEDSIFILSDAHINTGASDILLGKLIFDGKDVSLSNFASAISWRDVKNVTDFVNIKDIPFWSLMEISIDSLNWNGDNLYSEGELFIDHIKYEDYSSDSLIVLLNKNSMYFYLYNTIYNGNFSGKLNLYKNKLTGSAKFSLYDSLIYVDGNIEIDSFLFDSANLFGNVIIDTVLYEGMAYSADFPVLWKDSTLVVKNFNIFTDSDSLYGNLKFRKDSLLFSVNTNGFYVNIPDGGLDFRGNLKFFLHDDQIESYIDIKSSLYYKDISVDYAGLRGEYFSTLDFRNIRTDLCALLTNIETDTVIIDTLSIKAEGDSDIVDVYVKADNSKCNILSSFNIYISDTMTQCVLDTLRVYMKTSKSKLFNGKKMVYTYKNNMHRLSDLYLYSAGFYISVDSLVYSENKLNSLIDINISDLRRISLFFSIPVIMKGSVDIKGKLKGSPSNPIFSLSGISKGIQIDHFESDSVNILISGNKNDIKMQNLFVSKDDKKLTGEGRFIPNYKNIGSSIVELSLKGDSIPVKVFDLLRPTLNFENGWISLDFSLTGNISNPNSKGNIVCNGIGLYIPPAGLRIKDGYIKSHFRNDTLIVDTIMGKTCDRSRFDGRGYIVPGYPSLYYYFYVKGKNVCVHMQKPEIFAVANVEGDYSGDIKKGDLNAKVDVIKADIYIPFRADNTPKRSIKEAPYKAYYDVYLNMPNNVWLKNDDANIELSGNLHVYGVNEKFKIDGVAKARSGKVYYLDHPFEVKKAEFRFMGKDKLDPSLDILSVSNIMYRKENKRENVEIYLEIKGSMLHPEFNELYSVPPYDVKDIIALLNFGVLWSDIKGIDNITGNLSDKAIDYFLRTQVASRIRKTIGLDEVDISSGFLTGERSLTVSVGKYIGNKFYVWYKHNLFSTFTGDVFRGEYFINNSSSIVGERDEDGKLKLGVDFRWEF